MMPANSSTAQSHMLKPLRFINWNRLICSVAFCCLAVDKFEKRSSHLKLSHQAIAYTYLIKFCTKSDFSVEYVDVKKNSRVSPSNRLRALCPFIGDHGRIRARGRLSKAPFLITSRYPVILDGSNRIVNSLVRNTHIVKSHSANEQARGILMENYWILRCRLTVRQSIRNCLSCRRMLQQVSAILMADLPKDQLPTENLYPLYITGTDFIGPFPIYKNNNQYSRYIILFTCLVVRAVHLEVSPDLSIDSTFNCIRHFVYWRGK